jgi:transcriptional regulator with XRE-family HTH domain
MQKEIGQKIKALRSAKGLTLKEVSEQTDLSVGFLSMLENGRTTTALMTLKRIADALNENISTFFTGDNMQESTNRHVFNRSYNRKLRSLNGEYIYYSLGNENKEFMMDPMLVELLPGQKEEDVIQFKHRGEEITYVLEGVLTFYLDGQEHVLYPGDSYHGFGDVPHNFVNLSNKIVKVLYIITPPIWQNNQLIAPETQDGVEVD